MRIILVKRYTPSQQRPGRRLASAAADGGSSCRDEGESEETARASDATFSESDTHVISSNRAKLCDGKKSWQEQEQCRDQRKGMKSRVAVQNETTAMERG